MIIRDVQDMRYLSWSRYRKSSGTAGSFLKAYSDLGEKKVYYKISRYDQVNGITGHECINEIIVCRLLNILGIEHLEYNLIHARIIIDKKEHVTWICASDDFKNRGESKIALDVYYQAENTNAMNMLDFCISNGWEKYMYEMLLVDFLILNRDRHGANIEVLRDVKNKKIRLAPLFDHGLSLVLEDTEDRISRIDPMDDRRVQCCVGSSSTKENLSLIPKGKMPQINKLTESDKARIFSGLDDIIMPILIEKTWEMIWRRWEYYVDLCNQGRQP